MLESFGEAIADRFRANLHDCKQYAVMADESTDINNIEQLSLCVRVIN